MNNKTYSLGVGFRYSPYGPPYNPGVDYWVRLGQQAAHLFPGSQPEAIWIVSVLDGQGTRLTFPGTSDEPYISFSAEDENTAALELFDRHNFRVWLQVEPGEANMEVLFDLIMSRYRHHPCVVGAGVDVEWHHSSEKPEGEPVSDEEACAWLAALQKHGERYRLFLKHWEADRLPAKLRQGLLFVDDSQMFSSLDEMVAEFSRWGCHFHPAPVAFQIGYPADKKWWGDYRKPLNTLGEAILRDVLNTAGIFWVDFSALDVFPP